MFIYSGKSRLCECGIETTLKSINDEPLFTGDIVVLVAIDKDGIYSYMGGLTAVVQNKYTTYTDGTIVLNDDPGEPFIMGIRDSVLGKDFIVYLVKSYKNVVPWENWENFGFNYSLK